MGARFNVASDLEFKKQAVGVAFAAINRSPEVLAVHAGAGEWEWDIETKSGWVAIDTFGQLMNFYRNLQQSSLTHCNASDTNT